MIFTFFSSVIQNFSPGGIKQIFFHKAKENLSMESKKEILSSPTKFAEKTLDFSQKKPESKTVPILQKKPIISYTGKKKIRFSLRPFLLFLCALLFAFLLLFAYTEKILAPQFSDLPVPTPCGSQFLKISAFLFRSVSFLVVCFSIL